MFWSWVPAESCISGNIVGVATTVQINWTFNPLVRHSIWHRNMAFPVAVPMSGDTSLRTIEWCRREAARSRVMGVMLFVAMKPITKFGEKNLLLQCRRSSIESARGTQPTGIAFVMGVVANAGSLESLLGLGS